MYNNIYISLSSYLAGKFVSRGITHSVVPQFPIMAIRVLLYLSQHGKSVDTLHGCISYL